MFLILFLFLSSFYIVFSRWIWVRKVHSDQLLVPHRPLQLRVSRSITQNTENCQSKLMLPSLFIYIIKWKCMSGCLHPNLSRNVARTVLKTNTIVFVEVQARTWPSGKLPFECQKIAKNLTFFFNWQKLSFFFKKIDKNCHFFQQNCQWQFCWKKMTIFVN